MVGNEVGEGILVSNLRRGHVEGLTITHPHVRKQVQEDAGRNGDFAGEGYWVLFFLNWKYQLTSFF